MSDYQKVATVTSLASLKNVITDYHLQAGDRVHLKIDVISPMGYVFNVAGAENVFRPLMPDHMTLIDVWGEGDSGYVEMQATSPPLAAVLTFIGNNWLNIILAGVALSAIIVLITVTLKTVAGVASLPNLVVAGAALLALIFIIKERRKGGG